MASHADIEDVSHGRGGAGNILPDDTPYGDGEITREGFVGEGGDSAHLGGRGGAGNLETSSGLNASHVKHDDTDVVPEEAVVRPSSENYHVGRGGQGNVHKEDPPVPVHEGLADKLKHKILGRKKAPK